MSIIPCAGVSQAPNIYSILLGWGVATAKVIVDDDNAGTKEYNKIKKNLLSNSDEEAEYTLFKNTGCKGIEDTFVYTDFAKFASSHITPDSTKSNAELASGNKEIIARSFLDSVNKAKSPLKLTDLDAATQAKIKTIVEFIKK